MPPHTWESGTCDYKLLQIQIRLIVFDLRTRTDFAAPAAQTKACLDINEARKWGSGTFRPFQFWSSCTWISTVEINQADNRHSGKLSCQSIVPEIVDSTICTKSLQVPCIDWLEILNHTFIRTVLSKHKSQTFPNAVIRSHVLEETKTQCVPREQGNPLNMYDALVRVGFPGQSPSANEDRLIRKGNLLHLNSYKCWKPLLTYVGHFLLERILSYITWDSAVSKAPLPFSTVELVSYHLVDLEDFLLPFGGVGP